MAKILEMPPTQEQLKQEQRERTRRFVDLVRQSMELHRARRLAFGRMIRASLADKRGDS